MTPTYTEISQLILLVFCFTTPESDRVFHYLFTMILLAGSTTYYAQASDLGWSAVADGSSSRQVFYARYINWLIAFPSSALALGLIANVSWTTILSNVFLTWFWPVNYLIAAYVGTSYSWGFFAFGTLGWLILAASTINESHEAAVKLGIGRDYRIVSLSLNLVWLLYPVAFGLTDGAKVLSVTQGFIFFGILDVLSVPVWILLFLFMARKWSYATLHVNFSEHRFDPVGGHGTDGAKNDAPLA